MKKFILYLLFLLALCAPSAASAARLYLDPATLSAPPHTPFLVTVYLDPEGQDINALSGELLYAGKNLVLREIRTANSIVSMWIDPPQVDEAESVIRFSGMIPRGFTGVLSPFYEGSRPGQIFTLIFEAQNEGQNALLWREWELLLNDGLATVARARADDLTIKIDQDASNLSPVASSPEDRYAPDAFTPEVGRENSVFGGRWFVAFVTRDQGSGVDHYEVQEHRDPLPVASGWRVAKSPVVLGDQSRQSYVSVRVWDHEGNFRVATVPPAPSTSQTAYSGDYLWLIILLCFGLLFGSYSASRAISRRR